MQKRRISVAFVCRDDSRHDKGIQKKSKQEKSGMTKLLPGPRSSVPGHPALLAALRVARRQPWKIPAIRTWDAMKRFLQLTLLAALPLTMMAQPRTYKALSTEVPFKFNVGNRTFQPGHYQFILVGPGLLAMRDSHEHIVASFIGRSRETGGPAPASKLVFNTPKKHHAQLAEIWIENSSQVVEVLGEEVAVRQSYPPPAPPNVDSLYIDSLFNRPAAPGLKH